MPDDQRRPAHPLEAMRAERRADAGDHSCDPLEYMDELSNAGRWGDDDRLGTLNYITPAVRAAAAGVVRDGIAVGCSFEVGASSPMGRQGGMQRFMSMMPKDFGPRARAAEIAETVIMSTHGLWVTHVDAPNHLFWDGTTYNGITDTTVTGFGGAPDGDIAAIPDGVITRGVLLDVAALHGVDCLERGHGVTPEELEEAEARQGVQVRSGDVVLLRTGDGGRYRAASAERRTISFADGMAGWHPRCMPWLHEREVALMAIDAGQDPNPSGFEWCKINAGVHFIALARMGLWMMDWCNLEELSATCADLGRYEFLLSIGTLRLAGCSATPVQPVALF